MIAIQNVRGMHVTRDNKLKRVIGVTPRKLAKISSSIKRLHFVIVQQICGINLLFGEIENPNR